MADPHTLQLPSAADLVRAFIADLGNVLQGGSAKQAPTTIITFNAAAAETRKFVADRDYLCLGYFDANNNPNYVVSLDASNSTTIFNAAGYVKIGSMIGGTNGVNKSFTPQATLVPLGTTISVFNGGASAVTVFVILQIY